eukprot:497151-Amphidinium_carterae.1
MYCGVESVTDQKYKEDKNSLQRRAEKDRWDTEAVVLGLDFLGAPNQINPEDRDLPQSGQRRMYITQWWINTCNGTPGCPTCEGRGPTHTGRMSKTFEGIDEWPDGPRRCTEQNGIRAMGESATVTATPELG